MSLRGTTTLEQRERAPRAPLGRVIPLTCVVGFLLGTIVGFATAAHEVGTPPAFAALGLLLGAVAGLVWAMPHSLTLPAIHRPAPSAPAAAVAVAVEAPVAEEEWIVPPGWYPDPGRVRVARFWDGTDWTDHLADSLAEPPPE